MKDQWETKYLREGWTFAFGSLMGAYGLINKGKGIETDKFIEDAMKLFEHAQLMVRSAIMEAEEIEPEGVEPVKTGVDKTWEQRKFHQDLMEDDGTTDYQRNNK